MRTFEVLVNGKVRGALTLNEEAVSKLEDTFGDFDTHVSIEPLFLKVSHYNHAGFNRPDRTVLQAFEMIIRERESDEEVSRVPID
jgi:hypothetical protein